MNHLCDVIVVVRGLYLVLKRWEQAISLFAFAWFGRDPNLCSKSEIEFIVRKPIWSRTEAFENRGLTVLISLPGKNDAEI